MSLLLGSAISLEEVRGVPGVRLSVLVRFFLPSGNPAVDPAIDPSFAEDGRPRPPLVAAVDGLGVTFFFATLIASQAGLKPPLSRLPLPDNRQVSADVGRRLYGEPSSVVCRKRFSSVFEEVVRRSNRPSVVFLSDGGGWLVVAPRSVFPNKNSTSGPLSNGVKLEESSPFAGARRRVVAVWGRCLAGACAVPVGTCAPRLGKGLECQPSASCGAHLAARGWRLRR